MKHSRISRKTQKQMFLLVFGGRICAPELNEMTDHDLTCMLMFFNKHFKCRRGLRCNLTFSVITEELFSILDVHFDLLSNDSLANRKLY